jgi:hypothetical protein
MRPFILRISLIVFFLIQTSSGIAQIAPPAVLPPLQPIGTDPTLGQMCQGPLGPGRCEDVQRFLQIEQIAAQIQLQQTGFDPAVGPICMGPLGPGPCLQVRRFIAMQRLAAQQFRLRQIGTLPGSAPLCMGPLGPGPCDAIRNYLMQQNQGLPPVQNFDPARPQLINDGNTLQPMCNGPLAQRRVTWSAK